MKSVKKTFARMWLLFFLVIFVTLFIIAGHAAQLNLKEICEILGAAVLMIGLAFSIAYAIIVLTDE
jgi:hypothetical protein